MYSSLVTPKIHVLLRVITGLRDAEWLDAARAQAWVLVLAVATFTILAGSIAASDHGIDRFGRPFGPDFMGFWSASRLALNGHPAAAYEPEAQAAIQWDLFPSFKYAGYNPFLYPPVFLLLCLPLGLLPYFVSLTLWMSSGFLLLVACVRRVLPQRWAILPVVAFPGALENITNGQNGFISAACFGGGMLLLERSPLLAGICLGGLAFKPQLAMVVPVALISARRWMVVAGAAFSTLGLCGLSYLVLGEEAWRGFFQSARLSRDVIERGLLDPAKIQSLHAAVRGLHGGLATAYIAQIVLALGIAALLGRTAVRRPGAGAEGALLVMSSLLCTPYLVDYDLVSLAFPLAWVTAEAQKTGWRPWEKIVLLAAYMLPILSRPIATQAGIPIAPVVLVCLFLVVWKRANGPVRGLGTISDRIIRSVPLVDPIQP